MTLWKFKSCPRCKGDLFQDRDGVFECLQCGYRDNVKVLFRIKRKRNWLAEKAEAEISNQGICYPTYEEG